MNTSPCGCIPRDQMPQVDQKDLPAMFQWLASQGVTVNEEIMPPDRIRGHQKVNRSLVHKIPEEALEKPIVISEDNIVVDGNHRWATAHFRKRGSIATYVIGAKFDEALELVRKCPQSYTYGDGNVHPFKLEGN